MGLLVRYSDPRGVDEPAVLVALPSNIRFGDVTLTNSAHLGDVANSSLTLDDEHGLLDIVGLRALDVRETSAPSNNRVIGRYVIQDRTVSRSTERAALTATARVWGLDLSDYNWHLGKRLLVDADSNRPRESIGDRLRWLINDAAHINLNDYGHVTYPSRMMDANDYRLQRPIDVLNDCVIEDNFLFWADFNEAHGKPELFFIRPGSTDYGSTLSVTNDQSLVDLVTIFPPSLDATLTRSPSRIAFGAAVSHPGGFAYARKDSTGEQFAKLDQVAPMENVKTAARAERLAQKFVNDHDEETDVLEWRMIVPRDKVNDLRHGMWLPVLFTHLPGYTDWTGVRVLERTVMQTRETGRDHYELAIKATRGTGDIETPPAPPFTGPAIAALIGFTGSTDPGGGAHSFLYTGDNAGTGYSGLPTVGPFTVEDGDDHYIQADAPMTVRLSVEAWCNGVATVAESGDLWVELNGTPIPGASYHADDWSTGWNEQCLIDVPNLSLSAGDVLTLRSEGTGWAFGGFADKNTTAKNSSMMIVGRGSHTIPSGSYFGAVGPWVGP